MSTIVASLWLTVALATVAFVSWRISGAVVDREDWLPRVLVAAVLAWTEIVLVMELLGAVHFLRSDGVLAVQCAIAAAVWWRVRAKTNKVVGWPKIDHGWWLVVVIALPVLALTLVQSVGAPSFDWDTNRYHIVNAAHWLSTQEIWSLPFAIPGDNTAAFPGDSEIVGTWLMLPFHDDRLAYLGNVFFAALTMGATGLVARHLGRAAWLGALAGGLVVFSPAWAGTQPHSLMTDMPSVAALLAGLALGMMKKPWLAGLAFGLAVGTKYTMPVPALLCAAYLVATMLRPRIKSGLTLAVAAAATGGFWYLRNLVDTGNPFFPLSVVVGGHRLLATNVSPSTPSESSLLTVLLRDPSVIGNWISVLVIGTGFLAVAVALVPVANLVKRGVGSGLPGLGLLAFLLWLGFAATPGSSGGENGTVFQFALDFRYAVGPLAITMIWAFCRIPSQWVLLVALPSLAYDLAWILGPNYDRPDLRFTESTALVTGLVLLVFVTVALLVRRVYEQWPRIFAPLVGTGSVALLFVAILFIVTATGQPRVSSLVADSGGAQGAVVAIYHLGNVREVLGPSLDVSNLKSIGQGAQGTQIEVSDPGALADAVTRLNPAVVVIGQDPNFAAFGVLDPKSGWRFVGTIGSGAGLGRVYLAR